MGEHAFPSPDSGRAAAASDAFVSVIVPVRNESRFIGGTLDTVLAQDYPARQFEIVVVDGMSDDGTREIVAEYARRDPRIRLVDNPARVTPDGLNAAIAAARGDILSRVDGHCRIAPDFVSQNVRLLETHPEAWAVGGPMIHSGHGACGRAIALAMSHPLGVGMANHRFPEFEGYVDTVQFPAFRRSVFDRIGIFDTSLIRTEDDELNFRIAQAGGRMFVSPAVRYEYFVRERLRDLFHQYLQYSFWRIPVMRKHGRPTTVRQIVPLLFFAVLLAVLLGGLLAGYPLLALALPAIYLAALGVLALSLIRRHGLRVAVLAAAAVATMHIAYAAGMGYGLVAGAFGLNVWRKDGRMAGLSR